ncbi:hypothetical protein [Methanosarcina acetivorans]|uniref:Uncharacterized protein n=1 Tax=Methanosarcina acetivorans (strain ATCC 35395 / DSM 2834 / JCM 12185 / C2A) TaxID=188937 RepID=Q8TIL5_METAC|nr:hypothetical protein [Methanosarcina acetivorans]AAM07482.1 predicted protein [Methanosarcina acetivorans C2A]
MIQENYDTGVIQESCDTSVILQKNTDSEDPEIQKARELVNLVHEIRDRERINLKEACKLAGFSDKKYYNLRRKIPEL